MNEQIEGNGLRKGQMKITVSQIKEGDRFGDARSGWIALEDAIVNDEGARVFVKYTPDGGHGLRAWDSADATIKVTRDA
jgi:hypothetical protein